jgi:hypothetical protein
VTREVPEAALGEALLGAVSGLRQASASRDCVGLRLVVTVPSRMN